jgi:hypothetical protein
MSNLTVIEGDRKTATPRAGRRYGMGQSEQVTCWKCEALTGIATSRFRQVILAPRRRPDGKIVGGTKVLVCDYCDTVIR